MFPKNSVSNLNSGQWEELEEMVSSRAGDWGAGCSVGLGLGILRGQYNVEQVWPGREEACRLPGFCRTSGQRLDAESCTLALVCVFRGRTGARSSFLGLFTFSSLYGILPSCGRCVCLCNGNTGWKLSWSLLSEVIHVPWVACGFFLVFTGNYF